MGNMHKMEEKQPAVYILNKRNRVNQRCFCENGEHLNIHTCRWCTGRIDYSTGHFQEENRGIVDYGFDMYAPQTFAGKPVLMGWLNMWDRNVPSEKYGFAGMLTAPRSISVNNGRLRQAPIVNCTEVYKSADPEKIRDKAKVGVITVKATNLRSFAMKMRSDGEHYTELILREGQWVFDRSKSGEAIVGAEKDADSLNGIRRMPCSKEKEMTITIVMDEFSVEIFEGGRALSSTIYPPENAEEILLAVQADSWQYERAEIACKA